MEEKKIHILRNVGGLYLQFGIKSVTMDNVAQELGISKKTIYRHFHNKKDLIKQVIEYYRKNPVFGLSDKSLGNAIDRIFALRSHVVKILKHFNNNFEKDLKKIYPDLYKEVRRLKRQRIRNETIINVEDGINEGLFRAEISPEFVARMQVGLMLYTLNPDNEVFSAHEALTIKLFDQVTDYYMHAVCTENGLKYYRKQLNRIQNEENN